MGDTRYSFVRDLDGYIQGVTQGDTILDEYEKLDELDRAAEYIMLGMRRGQGISAQEYHKIYRSDFAPLEELLKEYEKDGWTKQTGERWSFTPTGFLLSNILIGSLLEAQAQHRISGNPWIEENGGIDMGSIQLPTGSELH
jgi:oxygen-independent coproporphyrinogen-3 oxidase